MEHRGHRVIEVYPYASKIRLWGKLIPKKSRPDGLGFLRDGLAPLLPSLADHVDSFDHDFCDAAVAAYTAYLGSIGEAEALGDVVDGLLWVPKEDALSSKSPLRA